MNSVLNLLIVILPAAMAGCVVYFIGKQVNAARRKSKRRKTLPSEKT